jgi:Tfp pilus assembly protein PilW
VAPDRSLWRSQSGVILLERLLAIAMGSAVAVATMFLWQSQQENYFRGSEAAQVQQDARGALLLMVRDLRQATGILTAQAESIVFQSAADADPAPQRTFDLGTGTGCASLCLRYNRGDGAGAQPIADGIVADGLQFTYRDANGAVLAALPLSEPDRLRVRVIDVALVGQTVIANPDPPFTFASSIRLRNR